MAPPLPLERWMSAHPPPPSRAQAAARVGAVVGLGLAVLVGLGISAQALWAEASDGGLLVRLQPVPFVAAVVAWWVASVLAGPRLVALLPPEQRAQAPAGWRLGLWMVGVHGLNLALPGPAGDLAFVGALVRVHGLPARSVVAATTFARVGGLATIGVLGLALLPGAPPGGPVGLVVRGAVACLAVGAVGLGVGALRPRWLTWISASTIGRLARHTPGGLGRALHQMDAGVAALAEGLATVARGGPRAMAITVGWSLLIQAALACSLFSAALAVGIPLPLDGLPMAHVAGELASVAVAVAPAGLGGFDGALAASLLAFCGLDGLNTALVVLSIRAVQLVALGAGTLAVAAAAPALFSPSGSRALGDGADGRPPPGGGST